MAYKKPKVIAQNSNSGSYAAGCPTSKHFPGSGNCNSCSACEISN